jgi:DnaK suppressor protein
MDSNTLNRFKVLFLSQKEAQSKLKHLANEDLEIPRDDLADDGDVSSRALQQAIKLRLNNREVKYAAKIDEALARIEDGTYGNCDECEESIELKRLEARPTTNMCIRCKESQERREQQGMRLLKRMVG